MSKTIYLAASPATRGTERFERYYYKIGHAYPGAELIEHGWPLALISIDTLIFIRDPDHTIPDDIWAATCQARKESKAVFLARFAGEHDDLVLVPYEKLIYEAHSNGSVTVETIPAKPEAKQKQKRKKAPAEGVTLPGGITWKEGVRVLQGS